MTDRSEKPEDLDDQDWEVLAQLGYAVARAQLWEHAMTKLLEVQRHDLEVPLDDRWDEILKWLKLPAGALAKKLALPDEVAEDLRAIGERRNHLAHFVWRAYVHTKTDNPDWAPDRYAEWLSEQARLLGRAYNALMAMVEAGRELGTTPLPDEQIIAYWRREVPEPIGGEDLPPTGDEASNR